MHTSRNQQVLLTARPTGIPQAEHFTLVERDLAEPADGELLVRNHYLSIDPAMRGWVADASNYMAPVAVGEVMRSLAVGEVLASRHPDYPPGEFVTGLFGWQQYAVVAASAVSQRVSARDVPLTAWLGILGLTGCTALLGLQQVLQPRAGEVMVVSTAAGAVGSAVGQIAKLMGCHTVGLAGGAEKVRLCLDAFGYDAAIDYKQADLPAALAQACPGGANLYWDNTAGAISDAVRARLAVRARVLICGTASVPSWNPVPLGPRMERDLLTKRLRVEGFVLSDHQVHQAAAVQQLLGWLRAGQLQVREDILDGLAACPDSIAGLYRGENLGKRLVRLV